MSANPPPPPSRRKLWVSWLGRAAALSIAAAVTLAAVQWLWPGDAPSWLSVSGVFFYFGVVLVALWTSVRLFGTSSRLQAPRRED